MLSQLRVVLKMKSWEHEAGAPSEQQDAPARMGYGLGECSRRTHAHVADQ